MPIIGSSASHGMSARLKPVVTGGTLTDDGTYYYRTFTSNGNLEVTGAPLTADVMLGAGGGGGNGGAGGQYGGGGAGGVVLYSQAVLTVASYSATIGAGGPFKASPTVAGGPAGNGTSTTLGSFGNTVGGGGAGGYAYSQGAAAGNSGGSGGGGGGNGGAGSPPGGATTQGSGSGYVGYGNVGGNGSGNGAGGAGGGGGGAGTAGQSAIVDAPGNAVGNGGSGGDGISTQFAGLQAWLSTAGIGQNVSGTRYFAGGGEGAYGTRTGYGSGSSYPSGGAGGGFINGSSGIVTIRYLKTAV